MIIADQDTGSGTVLIVETAGEYVHVQVTRKGTWRLLALSIMTFQIQNLNFVTETIICYIMHISTYLYGAYEQACLHIKPGMIANWNSHSMCELLQKCVTRWQFPCIRTPQQEIVPSLLL